MPRYYIHAEAFNLDSTVYDTHDISTIRGGSFMLLNAIKQLPATIPNRLEPIATAASKGVFAYEDPGDLAAQRKPEDGMATKVLRALHDATDGHATFLVAVEEDSDDFSQVLARLEAEVRRQQWRTPTVVVPSFEGTNQECYLDGWRPGVERYNSDLEGIKISAATHYRRQRGQELKHTLFRELFANEDAKDDPCAKDLGGLATDPSKGILNGKIAFIHVDGNSFGRIRGAKCTTPDTRRAFDECIQERRLSFLADLRTAAHAESDFCVRTHTGRDVLRLEVLLWGGDEFTLVVPAWKGVEVLERFFRAVDSLEFNGVPMTHRAAIIFCHHNAPILQIRRLAEDLLKVTKNNIRTRFEAALNAAPALSDLSESDRSSPTEWLSNARYGNAVRYLVLESFDMLRGSLDQFLERYYGKADTSDMLLYGCEMAKLRENLHPICTYASKGRVIEVARALIAGDTARADELRKGLSDSVAPNQRAAVCGAIEALTKGNDAGWRLLADLWDYAEEWKA
jgi:hypothetical protein